MEKEKELKSILNELYAKEKTDYLFEQLSALIKKYSIKDKGVRCEYFSEQDVVLITYGDSLKRDGERPLETLTKFVNKYLKGIVSSVHILPFFPYSSDDGFSVIDYYEVNPDVGTWEDVSKLNEKFDLMFDYVLNHISSKSKWFENFLNGIEGFENFAISVDPSTDLSMVTRPRALPLLSEYEKSDGEKVSLWTTFSADQIDVNFSDEETFLRMAELLLFYMSRGAKIIRLDAIAYLWKIIGTNCIHLRQTHLMVKLFRILADECTNGGIILTETNVPHKENVSYFGSGDDEAQMVYNFTLPPLLFYSFLNEDISVFRNWVASLSLPTKETSFFNFTASHDGIGVRPLEGIVPKEEVEKMAEAVKQNGGRVSYKTNADGSESPYELNITYVDAMKKEGDTDELHAKRFIASQSIQAALPGVHAVYVHSILGSHNWEEGVGITNRARTINREKLNYDKIVKELETENSFRYIVYNAYKRILSVRTEEKAFHPNAPFEVYDAGRSIFAIKRGLGADAVYCLVNISKEETSLSLEDLFSFSNALDLLSGKELIKDLRLSAYEILWLKEKA